jgi:hypothetical protein
MNASAFWSHVDRSGGPDACHPWTGARTGSGYGCLQYGGKIVYAHRLAYEFTVGPLLPGEEVRHTECNNPPCCNGRHLAKGTHADNMQDMARAGRVRRAVLSEADVARIRTTDAPATVLAVELGCTPTAVQMARRGETYKGLAA